MMNSFEKFPTPDTPPSKPSIGVRLRSWKWWVYGDANSQPRERPPKGFYFQLAFGVVLWTLIAGHPWLTSWINRHPPEFSSLEMARGVVVRTARKNPHLDLRLPSGVILNMEFPVFLNTLGSLPGGTGKLGNYNEQLLGCNATVWFDVPRYTPWKRYRVWQVVCENAQTAAFYSEIVSGTSWSLDLTLDGIFVFLVLPFGMGIWLIRYRRGYYER